MAPSRGLSSYSAFRQQICICQRHHFRGLSTSGTLLSGHNRWSKIKHDKARNDAGKNRQRSVFAKEIATASKLFGPEPGMNPRLADLITKAKREGFAKASIEAAIARGQGRSVGGANLESVTVEGMLPNNVAVIVDSETDNKARTLTEVRAVLKEYGGSASSTSYLFDKKGRIVFERNENVSADDALEAALEAGATDVVDGEDGSIIVFSETSDVTAVGEALSNSLGLQIATSGIIWDPKEDTKIDLPSTAFAQQLADFMDDLQERESTVNAVAMNVAQGDLETEAWRDLQTRINL